MTVTCWKSLEAAINTLIKAKFQYWDIASNDASSQEKDPVYTLKESKLLKWL